MKRNKLSMDPSLVDLIKTVDGWLEVNEAALLYHLARNCKGTGVIVEIGSWKGRSTTCLGTGSKNGQKLKVYAIDPHVGSYEHQQRSTQPIWTYDIFTENIKRSGLTDLIHPMVKTSEEAANNFDRPVELLFIDGAHEYEAVKKDLELWFPKVVNGGIIALHDTVDWVGPNRVVHEYFENTGLFSEIDRVGTITYGIKTNAKLNIVQKVKQRAFFNKFDKVSAAYFQNQ